MPRVRADCNQCFNDINSFFSGLFWFLFWFLFCFLLFCFVLLGGGGRVAFYFKS